MAALSLFPAISDDFSAEFFAAIAVILTDKIQLTQFPSFFDRLNRTSFSHRPQAAADKVAMIPTFHAVECDREMAFDVCLVPASPKNDRFVSVDLRIYRAFFAHTRYEMRKDDNRGRGSNEHAL